jgi:hypothetical protein
MTIAARPAKLVVLALLALALLLAGELPSASSASSPAPAVAAKKKLKKCKKGLNSKRCKCPKGSKLVKKGHKYRCKKKPQPTNTNTGSGGNTTTNTNTNTGTNTGTGTQTNADPPPPPPAGVQPQRDDAAFSAALESTLLRRYEEGTYGYGRYAYNFLPGGQFLYCSYYYASSTVESNRAGSWEVREGYTVPGYPGYTAGLVHIVGSDFDAVIGVEMLNDRSNVKTGNVSNVFTEGAFTRTIGGATTNCSAIQ